MNLKRIFSVLTIWSMLLSNIAFAYDFKEKSNAQGMLAPVVHIDAALFQQGFDQGAKISDLESDDMDIAKLISQFIAASDDSQNNPILQDLFTEIKAASEMFKQGNEQMSKAEKGGRNKDVNKAIYTGVEYWKKSVKCLDRIDVEALNNVFSESNQQIVSAFLRFKAEVLFSIVETDSKLELNQNAKLSYYAKIKELLEKAIALPGDQIDFRGMTVLANACANLSSDGTIPIEKKLVLSEDAVTYFELAIEMQSSSLANDELNAKTDQIYYSYFTALSLAGDICWNMETYSKAIVFYEKAVPLCPRLRIYEDALKRIKQLYQNYTRVLLARSREFRDNIDKGSPENRVAVEALFKKTMLIAYDSMSFFQATELVNGENLDPMVCGFTAQEELLKESLRNKDFEAVANGLLPLILQLKQMNKIVTKDQLNNYTIANMNIELIEIIHDIIREYIRVNGVSDLSIDRMAEMFDKDFFSAFLEKVQAGEYNDILKKIKKEDKLNDALLWKAIMSGSAGYNQTCKYLEKSLKPNKVPANSPAAERERLRNNNFKKGYACFARILLAFIYLQKGNYELAVSQIKNASDGYGKDFLENTFFVKQILIQAVLAQEKGRAFIAELLESKKTAANIMEHKKLLIPKSLDLIEEVIKDNPKLGEDNPELLGALGIVIPQIDIAEPVIKNNVLDNREIIKSFEVLRKSVVEALGLIDYQNGNNKSRSKKKKRKQVLLHVKASPIRQFENALSDMIEADKKLGVKPVFEYLRDQIFKESVFKNRFAMGALVWTIANMDESQSLEILNSYIKDYKTDGLSRQELAKAFGAVKSFAEYKKQMVALEQRIINSPRLEVRGSVYAGLGFELFNQNLDKFEKRATDLTRDFLAEITGFFSLEDMFVSQKNYKQLQDDWVVEQTKKINDLLAELRSQSVSIDQDRIKAKVEEFLADVKKFEFALYEAQAKTAYAAKQVSPAEGVLLLRQWDKDMGILIPADEISGFSDIKEALSNTNYNWETYSQEMKRQEEKISFVVGNKISFDISDDLYRISFANEALTPQDMRNEKDVINAMCEAVEALLSVNPDIEIQTAVKGKDNPGSKVFFMPLIAKVKAQMVVVQKNKYKAKQIIDEVNQFFEKYEASVKRIIESDMFRIEKIRQLDLLLDDAYNETVSNIIVDNPGIIYGDYDDEWEKRYDDIDVQHSALQIGNGAMQVRVVGIYEKLEFTLNRDMDFRAVESEIREIWQGALVANMEILMQLSNGNDRRASWVEHIRDIWEEEYDLATEAKKNKENLNQPVAVDSRSFIENIRAVAQAI